MSKALRIFQGRFGRVALLDMDKGLVVHAHPHCHVLLKASGADTFFSVRDELLPLRDETAVLVNAWEPHSYAHQSGAPQTVILALYIEPGWLAAMQRDLSASSSPGFFSRPCVTITPKIRRLADQMTRTMMQAGDGGAGSEQLLFDLMIAVIERFSEWRDLRGGARLVSTRATDFRVRRAVSFMRERIGGDFSIKEAARAAGLSRAHLFRMFQQNMNLTPQIYFNVLRMEAAVKALASHKEPLCDVSARLGFGAPSHFTRFFRHHQGVVPGDYRRAVSLFDAAGRAAGPASI